MTRTGIVCIFAYGENQGSHQCLHWWQQYATGILRWNLSIPDGSKKRHTPNGVHSIVDVYFSEMGLRPMGISHGLKTAHPQFCPLLCRGRPFDSRTAKKDTHQMASILLTTYTSARWGFAPWESPTASKLLIRSFALSFVEVGLSIPVRQKKTHTKWCVSFFGDPYGNRTHVTAVKGRCLNRLTNGPGSGDLT